MTTQSKSMPKGHSKIVMSFAVIGLISILLSACKPGGTSDSSTPTQMINNGSDTPGEYSASTEDIINHCQQENVFCLGQGVIAMPVRVDIPQGSYVADAFMKFFPFHEQSSYQKDIKININIEHSSGKDFSTVLAKTGSVFSDSIVWELGEWKNSPDPIVSPSLAERLQVIVNEPNWKAGNYVTLIFQNIQHDYTEGELRLAYFPKEKLMISPELTYNYVKEADKLKIDILEKGAQWVEDNYDFVSNNASLVGVNSSFLFEQSQALLKPKENTSAPSAGGRIEVGDSIISKPSPTPQQNYELNLGAFQSWWDQVVSTVGDAIIIEKNLPTSNINLLEGSMYKLSITAYGVNMNYKWYKNGQLIARSSNSSMSIQAPKAGATDRYHVVIQSAGDKVTSNTATVNGIAPSNKTAVGTAKLSWTAPLTRQNGESLSMAEIAGYKIGYYKEGEPQNKAQLITINEAYTTEKVITNLSSGTKYYFFIRVKDINGLESPNSTLVSKVII